MNDAIRTDEEKIAALDAFFFAMEGGDSEKRAMREVCIEFDCTEAEVRSWDLELEYVPN